MVHRGQKTINPDRLFVFVLQCFGPTHTDSPPAHITLPHLAPSPLSNFSCSSLLLHHSTTVCLPLVEVKNSMLNIDSNVRRTLRRQDGDSSFVSQIFDLGVTSGSLTFSHYLCSSCALSFKHVTLRRATEWDWPTHHPLFTGQSRPT